jgi:hypothetical protein
MNELFASGKITSMPKFDIIPHSIKEDHVTVIAHVEFDDSGAYERIALDYLTDHGYEFRGIYFASQQSRTQ